MMRILAALILAVMIGGVGVPADARERRAAYYASLARQEARLAAVAYRLTTANAGWCPVTVPQPGWILGDLRRFDAGDRPAAGSAYGTSDGPFVAALAPDSPVERAGLAPGTRIAAINGQPVSAPGDEPTIRIDTIIVMVNALDPAASWAITDTDGHIHQMAPAAGCASAFRVELGGPQAAANGALVRVTLRLAQSIAAQDELAAVVAHELAHNILRHRVRLGSDRSASRIRQTEFEADRLSVWLMAGAGYDPAAAVRFWGRHKRPLIRDASHPPRSERIAAIEQEIAAMRSARAAEPAAGPLWITTLPPLE